jgi:hypothetical protein
MPLEQLTSRRAAKGQNLAIRELPIAADNDALTLHSLTIVSAAFPSTLPGPPPPRDGLMVMGRTRLGFSPSTGGQQERSYRADLNRLISS